MTYSPKVSSRSPVEADIKQVASSWAEALERVVSSLKVVSQTTEDEFLEIGGRLQEFHQRAGEISSAAAQIVGEVAGAEVASAMEGVGDILDEMSRYLERSRNDSGTSSETLHEVTHLLQQASAPLAGFKKINKVLRMLGISTRIESARLGQSAAGFDTLANDVGALSVQVSDKAAIIVGRKVDLDAAIGQTLNGILAVGLKQHAQVMGILGKTRESLGTLTGINTRCSAAAAEVSASSEELSRSIGQVVMSMQAHDIVRQQVEHVEEALLEVHSHLSQDSAGIEEVAGICELQGAQLKHAARELETAVQAIIMNLREIAGQQSGLSRETASLAGIADEAGSGFFGAMEQDLSLVTTTLTESAKVNDKLTDAMGGVTGTVREIAGLVGEIETLGEEIKLIALNAQIKSAYTGEEGAALGVLAEAIQRLSVEAIEHTGAVSNTLQGIHAVTERLNIGVSQENSILQEEVQRMVATLAGLLNTLRGVNLTLRNSLSRMDQEVHHLCADIERVTVGIKVHQKVTKVLGDAVLALEGILKEARIMVPGVGKGVNFEELSQRYTMHSERKIHSSVLGRTPVAVAAPPQGEDELGGNVELF